jgi:hypothetical protein
MNPPSIALTSNIDTSLSKPNRASVAMTIKVIKFLTGVELGIEKKHQCITSIIPAFQERYRNVDFIAISGPTGSFIRPKSTNI